MSETPTQPRKFTYCIVPTSEMIDGPTAYYRKVRRHVPGLLFEPPDDAELDEVRKQICLDPTVTSLLGETVIVQPAHTGLVVTGSPKVLPLPDQARADDVVDVVHKGKHVSLPVLSRFTTCMEPMRDILGCSECDKAGFQCLVGAAAPPENSELDVGDLKEALKHNKTTAAGYVYVSPGMVADDGEAIARSERTPSDIDWTNYEVRSRQARNNANAAAATRKFKKDNCASCLVQAVCRDRHHYCVGKFPAEDEVTASVLARWEPRLKASKLARWQLYALAYHAGDTSPRCINRRKVALGGVFWNRNKKQFEARVVAFKRNPDREALVTDNYELLRTYFPSLPEKFDKNRSDCQTPDDQAMALWLTSCAQRHLGARLVGFHGYRRDPVAVVGMRRDGTVEIGDASSWGISLRYFKTISKWRDFYGYFDSLPAKQVKYREQQSIYRTGEYETEIGD